MQPSYKIRVGKKSAGGWIKLLQSFVLSLLLAVSATAEALVNQEVEKPDSLYLGSRFQLRLSSDAEIMDVLVPDTLKAFAVLKKAPLKERGRPQGMQLTIVALDTGEQVFPALTVKKLSSTQDTDLTRPFRLEILETRAPEDSVLADIASLQKLRGELPYWMYYALPVLLAIGVAVFLIWYLQRRKRLKAAQRRTAPAMSDTRPNWKRALEELYELNRLELPLKGDFITYHFRLSEIMKVYLESEYGFPANEMTSREIKHYLKAKPELHLPEQEKLLNWLDDCDRVKFAKHVPKVEDCEAKMDWFMRWLMANRKPDTPETPGES